MWVIQLSDCDAIFEVDAFQHWVEIAWLLAVLAVESHWLALGGPVGLENSPLAMYT